MVLCLESVNAVYHLRELIGLPVTLPKCVQRSTNHTQTWSIQYAHGNVFNFYGNKYVQNLLYALYKLENHQS